MNQPIHDRRDDFGSVVSAGVSLLFSRLGFFLGGATLCVLPTIVMSAIMTAMQWEFMTQMWGHLTDLEWQNAHRPGGLARIVQLATYPVMIGSVAMECAFVARAGLDQLEGKPDTLLGTLKRCARPAGWLALLDTLLALGMYVGCACCCLPGVVGFVFVSMWLGFQTVILCDEPVNWIVAGQRSKALSVGREGTMVGISALYLGSFLVVTAIILGLGAGLLELLNGGFDVNAPTFSQSAAAAYGAYSLGIWVPGTLIFCWYTLARVALYHRITRAGRGAEVVHVFA